MQYLDVNNWDAVLAMFGEGRRFAGAWGFLEVLRQAELVDTAGVEAIMDTEEGWWESFGLMSGKFLEQKGRLMLELQGNTAMVDAGLLGEIGRNLGDRAIYRRNDGYVVNRIHIHVVDRGVDWGGVAVAGTGIVLDIASGGTPGFVVDFGKTGSTVLGLTFLTIDGLKVVESINRGEFSASETGETVFWDAVGFVPIAGDASYIGYQFYKNVYIGP